MGERRNWVLGVWCGAGTKLLAPVHQDMSLLKLTLKRCGIGFPLVPWNLIGMADEVKALGYTPVSCHPENLVAMRDLVVKMDAAYAALVDGSCGVIDREEIELAIRRLQTGKWEEYLSPRVMAYPEWRWLQAAETGEWSEPGTERKIYWGMGDFNQRTASLRAR